MTEPQDTAALIARLRQKANELGLAGVDYFDAAEALAAQARRIEEERDRADRNFKSYERIKELRISAERERDAARAALAEYGMHKRECDFITKKMKGCTCGLTPTLAALGKRLEPTP